MAKIDTRLHDLSSAGAPAWFGAVPAVSVTEDTGAWAWLADEPNGSLEVVEYPVNQAFIEALFGPRH